MLPRLQHESLPGPFTLGVLEALDESDGSGRCLPVEIPPFVQRIPEVIVVSLDGQLHQLAGQDPPSPDILCVLFGFASFFPSFYVILKLKFISA